MVAFSINITLDIVYGNIVRVLVAVRLTLLVTLKYIALAGSSVALATVVSVSASEPKDASVAYPKALAMRDKLVLVFVPHVPEAQERPR